MMIRRVVKIEKNRGKMVLPFIYFTLIIYTMSTDSKNEVFNFNPATQQESTVKIAESPITIDLVKEHISNAKKMQAQVRSVISKTYPESKAGNSLSSSIYANKAFGFGDGQSFEENRVTWMDCPVGSTVESVEHDLQNFPEARIYRILSLEPILTGEQKGAMEVGLSTYVNAKDEVCPVDMDYYKEKQRVVNTETGEWVDYKDLPQYRVLHFSPTGQPDLDLREKEYQASRNTEAFQMSEAPSKEEIEKKVEAGEF